MTNILLKSFIKREIAEMEEDSAIVFVLNTVVPLVSPEREDLEKVVATIKYLFPGEGDDVWRVIYNIIVEMYDILTYGEDCDGRYYIRKKVDTSNGEWIHVYNTDIWKQSGRFSKKRDAKKRAKEVNGTVSRVGEDYIVSALDREYSKKLADEHRSGHLYSMYSEDEFQEDPDFGEYWYTEKKPTEWFEVIDKETGELADFYGLAANFPRFLATEIDALAFMYRYAPTKAWMALYK